jgi:hypothetical protein
MKKTINIIPSIVKIKKIKKKKKENKNFSFFIQLKKFEYNII